VMSPAQPSLFSFFGLWSSFRVENLRLLREVTALNKRNFSVKNCFFSYPEVIIDPAPLYCNCREKEYAEYGSFNVRPRYCPKHNVIIMENLFLPKNSDDSFQSIIEIVNHETLH